ncbi:maleylpyruvate isomerase family mycothiol-dependent enzyme [Nocardioides sp. Kera G14]|uniref:maleylpyruvate isomerase family mycothiol-dependent enzyme n=1 Tax=Nocardioides sp. Kera G14 TaxID=2884264 RepID=UPI001D10C8EB|nr:maleylpyruvate isomerase family mycothiol-dependent enzyme [Nocardioides sp. Kera G14]UDY24475.1 maleylpyruvate isomerase family mycothiol-dependent enzyme [Nocardioides sp. Kera G14]
MTDGSDEAVEVSINADGQMGILALIRSLEQAATILDTVTAADLERPTPCTEWDVRRLANHLIAQPRVFVTMLQGSPPGWNGREDYAAHLGDELRTRGNTLINLWREVSAADALMVGDPDWQSAEIAIHTWDLAVALGRSTADLDEPVAQRALVTLDRTLGPTRKGRAWQDARRAPDGSHAYEHLAAYAGRPVPWQAPA